MCIAAPAVSAGPIQTYACADEHYHKFEQPRMASTETDAPAEMEDLQRQ